MPNDRQSKIADRKFSRPTALVTGAAKRVGRVVALALARAGFDVAITYNTSAAEAKGVVAEIVSLGRLALAIRADLARPDGAAEVYRQFTRGFGSLSVLVNNASVFTPSPLAKITAQDLERNMAVNARAPMLLIQQFTPLLGARGAKSPGRVINFIDMYVLGKPHKGFAAYNMSKAALYELTKTAAVELAPRITVNAIAPGVIEWGAHDPPAKRRAYMRNTPLRRIGTPEEAAAAVVFLATDATYCTGQVIRLDGGRLLV